VADLLDQLALETEARAILLYLEGIGDGRKFMSAARIAAAAKPVVVLKAGRDGAGAKAAFSHTGALAGAAAVYDAAFRRAGLVQVDSLGELLDAGAAFSAFSRSGPRLAILTNGGGAGVLAADRLSGLGEALVELRPETLARLGAIAPAAWSHGNPVDVLGDAKPELYAAALTTLREAEEVDAVLALHCPTGVTDSLRVAEAAIAAAAGAGRKPIVAGWLGQQAVAAARARFAEAGLPCFETPEAAAQALVQLVRRGRAREVLHLTAVDEARVDVEAARRVVRAALAAGRRTLSDPEARDVLRAYGVPVIASEAAATPAAAGAAAARLGGPVALKILSPDLSHKSDVGGVRLGLAGAAATERASGEMLAHVRTLRPEARIEGFIVEPMIERPEAQEMLAGVVRDPTFGPVIAVAEGGVAVEARGDRALGLPPLDAGLAREMVARTRVARLLAGYRGRPPADIEALGASLVALGRLALDIPEVAELDINPLLCDAGGVLALDARIALTPVGADTPRPAILPYPGQLAREAELDGQRIRIRPIKASDAARLTEMVDLCTPQDVHLRFVGGMRHLPENLVVRLTQLDYDRQMAFAAEDRAGAFLGVGRLACDPDGRRGEFALMVRSDAQRRGLGRRLLETVLDYARSRGLDEVWGDVAHDNARMLRLAQQLGFTTSAADELGRVEVRKALSHALAPS
jgi:acetyltransferase